MKKTTYIVPANTLTDESSKEVIAKAIESLSTDYLINSEFMEINKKVEHLELIANLTHLYFNMKLASIKE